MKQIIADAFILHLSGAATYKNGKEITGFINAYNNPITIEFPTLSPNYVVIRCYHENGQLHWEDEYQNGKRHGVSKRYYKNGQLNWKTECQNGKYHGYLKCYHSDGQLEWEREYQNGEPIRKIK